MPYVAVVLKESQTAFSLHFPDLPGCSTVGKTMQQARRQAAEVLAVHLQEMAAAGRPLPIARTLGAIRDDPQCQTGTTLILVEALATSS